MACRAAVADQLAIAVEDRETFVRADLRIVHPHERRLIQPGAEHHQPRVLPEQGQRVGVLLQTHRLGP